MNVDRLVLNRTVEPAIEPVMLDEAKLHLRVDGTDEDTYITALITAAREHVEDDAGRALLTQTWERKLDCFPLLRWDAILLPRPPLQAVTEISYNDPVGNTQTLAPSVYVVDASSTPGRVTLASGQQWPATIDEPNAVTVTYTAGYGATAADVPESLIHAIKLLVSQQYEHREPEITGSIATQLGMSYNFLVSPFRVWWL